MEKLRRDWILQKHKKNPHNPVFSQGTSISSNRRDLQERRIKSNDFCCFEPLVFSAAWSCYLWIKFSIYRVAYREVAMSQSTHLQLSIIQTSDKNHKLDSGTTSLVYICSAMYKTYNSSKQSIWEDLGGKIWSWHKKNGWAILLLIYSTSIKYTHIM